MGTSRLLPEPHACNVLSPSIFTCGIVEFPRWLQGPAPSERTYCYAHQAGEPHLGETAGGRQCRKSAESTRKRARAAPRSAETGEDEGRLARVRQGTSRGRTREGEGEGGQARRGDPTPQASSSEANR